MWYVAIIFISPLWVFFINSNWVPFFPKNLWYLQPQLFLFFWKLIHANRAYNSLLNCMRVLLDSPFSKSFCKFPFFLIYLILLPLFRWRKGACALIFYLNPINYFSFFVTDWNHYWFGNVIRERGARVSQKVTSFFCFYELDCFFIQSFCLF